MDTGVYFCGNDLNQGTGSCFKVFSESDFVHFFPTGGISVCWVSYKNFQFFQISYVYMYSFLSFFVNLLVIVLKVI